MVLMIVYQFLVFWLVCLAIHTASWNMFKHFRVSGWTLLFVISVLWVAFFQVSGHWGMLLLTSSSIGLLLGGWEAQIIRSSE